MRLIDCTQKMKFSIKDLLNKCDEIPNGRIHFLCSDFSLHYRTTSLFGRTGIYIHCVLQ